jgi:hypothetical protein
MKKFQTLGKTVLVLLAFSSLTAMGEETTTADYAQQLPAFVNQVSVWKPKSNASYAYTDLDQDGMLEILTSYTSKKGEVTNGLWELRDGRLTECSLPWEEEEAQTELKEQKVPVYYDGENDVYYYLFGTASEEEDAQITALWLKDGELNAEVLEEEPEVRFAGMEQLIGTFGWVSTAEHTLKDAPLEQLTEIGGESIGRFTLKAEQ